MSFALPHCGERLNDCKGLSKDIKSCQSRGVEIMLSIGGLGYKGFYTLTSTDDAREVAKYLWDKFLGGQSDSRPLGDAVLDGIDFDIGTEISGHWAELAKTLEGYRDLQRKKKYYLSASPQCALPNAPTQHGLETGLFDYVWVKFFNDESCQYLGSVVKASWIQWVSLVVSAKVFVGVPSSLPSEMAFTNGSYFPPHVLFSQVLPFAKLSSNYGGLMIRFTTFQDGYSLAIKLMFD